MTEPTERTEPGIEAKDEADISRPPPERVIPDRTGQLWMWSAKSAEGFEPGAETYLILQPADDGMEDVGEHILLRTDNFGRMHVIRTKERAEMWYAGRYDKNDFRKPLELRETWTRLA